MRVSPSPVNSMRSAKSVALGRLDGWTTRSLPRQLQHACRSRRPHSTTHALGRPAALRTSGLSLSARTDLMRRPGVPRCAFSSRAGEPHLGDTRANGSVFWLVSMLPFGALGEGPKGSERLYTRHRPKLQRISQWIRGIAISVHGSYQTPGVAVWSRPSPTRI
jgi:hypothetical protein